jgi:hypothetical protein
MQRKARVASPGLVDSFTILKFLQWHSKGFTYEAALTKAGINQKQFDYWLNSPKELPALNTTIDFPELPIIFTKL